MKKERVLYWDASAVIATLVSDIHSEDALLFLEQETTHLVATFTHAEVCAVIARLLHSGVLDRQTVQGIFHGYDHGPWADILVQPDRSDLERIAMRVSLRGADLWHIACVHALQDDIPEISLLTYDNKMRSAARNLSLPLA